VPVTLAAAAKGKHVLCEKPIALTAAEAKTLRSAPPGILIAEAFMVRHHPQWLKARALVRQGKLGTPLAIQSLFTYFNVDPNDIRNVAAMGGGAAYDIGCYPIVVARYIFGAEPVRVMALIDRDPKFATDRLTSALIDFGDGRHLTFTVSTQLTPYQRVNILGTKARLEVEIPFNAPQGGAMTLYLDNGKKLADASAKAIRIAKADQYQLEVEAFGRAIHGEEPLEFGIDDAVLQARVLDAVFRSEKSGRWEKP
jgi:predicted dehydrogenase